MTTKQPTAPEPAPEGTSPAGGTTRKEIAMRAMRFPPDAKDARGTIQVAFEIRNESFTGALLHLQIQPGQNVTIQPEGRVPTQGKIARIETKPDGTVALGIVWHETAAHVGRASSKRSATKRAVSPPPEETPNASPPAKETSEG